MTKENLAKIEEMEKHISEAREIYDQLPESVKKLQEPFPKNSEQGKTIGFYLDYAYASIKRFTRKCGEVKVEEPGDAVEEKTEE